MNHLRYAGTSAPVQQAVLEQIIRTEPVLMETLAGLRDLALPDHLLVAGAIYNTVWNRLTGRPSLHGIKDIDVFYFDGDDLGYEAEDAVIRKLEMRFAHLPLPVEPRNQARVHLWFPEKFDQPFEPLQSSGEMLERYASKTHAVAARLETDDTMSIFAPFGLDYIFSFRIAPNHYLVNNRAAHEQKGARALRNWPEITLEPW